MKLRKYLLVLIWQIMIFTGCKNDDFSPFRDFENNYVVYCVLDNRLRSQFVEIQKVFYPGIDKKLPGNTKVTITELPDSNYILKDTIITGREDYSVFYLDNFQLKRGKSYRLYIRNDPYSDQFAEVTIPFKYTIGLTFDKRIEWDSLGHAIVLYTFNFRFLNGMPSVYVYHLYYEYETSKGIGSIEVPIYAEAYPDTSLAPYLVYPNLLQVMNSPSSTISYWWYPVEYPLAILRNTLKNENVKIKRGYLVLYSIDQNLYTYYLSENGYADPFTIRLDRPYWTDIKTTTGQGIGLFGAVCTDTFSFKLPHDLIVRYGLIDAQNY